MLLEDLLSIDSKYSAESLFELLKLYGLPTDTDSTAYLHRTKVYLRRLWRHIQAQRSNEVNVIQQLEDAYNACRLAFLYDDDSSYAPSDSDTDDMDAIDDGEDEDEDEDDDEEEEEEEVGDDPEEDLQTGEQQNGME